MLKKENVEEEIDWDKIVGKTKMFSGDDIKNLCRDAGMAPLRRLMMEESFDDLTEIVEKKDQLKGTPISEEDFIYALANVKPSNNDDLLEKYSDWMEEKGSS